MKRTRRKTIVSLGIVPGFSRYYYKPGRVAACVASQSVFLLFVCAWQATNRGGVYIYYFRPRGDRTTCCITCLWLASAMTPEHVTRALQTNSTMIRGIVRGKGEHHVAERNPSRCHRLGVERKRHHGNRMFEQLDAESHLVIGSPRLRAFVGENGHIYNYYF